MRRALAGLSLIAAISLSAGCGPRDSRTVLHFWAMGREGEVVGELIPEFERLHPEIRVRSRTAALDRGARKAADCGRGRIRRRICANSAIAGSRNSSLSRRSRHCSSASTASATIQPRGLFQRHLGLERGGRRDLRRALVCRHATAVLPDRSDRGGRLCGSAGELERVAARAGGDQERAHGERFGILLPLNDYDPLIALALQQSQPMLRDNGTRGNFASRNSSAPSASTSTCSGSRYAPSVRDSEISNVWTEFGRGYFAFYISGPWDIGEFRRRLPAALDGKWMTAPLPGPDGPGASIAGGSSLAVFRGSKHADAAWQLIEFLSQPAVQQQFHAIDRQPAAHGARHGPLPKSRPTPRPARFAINWSASSPRPKVAEWERIATEMQLMTERVVRGDLSVHEAAVELDTRTDAILAKRRQLLAEGAVL
jgi:multiple sugar transport system substrate-binding protein